MITDSKALMWMIEFDLTWDKHVDRFIAYHLLEIATCYMT